MALLPPSSLVTSLSPPDWLAHAAAYGVQAGLVAWALMPGLGRRGALVGGVIGASAFGLVTEGLQLLGPGRSVELADVVANMAGAILVCGAIALIASPGMRGGE
jgi:VanZ family protein